MTKPWEYHYTRDGHGVLAAVRKMFERGTFLLGEGDALIPVQDAYKAWREANEVAKQIQD